MASFDKLHIPLSQVLEGAVAPSKDLSPGPSQVSFSMSEGLCLTVPSSHSSSLVLHLDPIEIYLAVIPRVLLPKVCRKRKCVLLLFRNLNFSLCVKQKHQTSKSNVRKEQQLSDCEIRSNSCRKCVKLPISFLDQDQDRPVFSMNLRSVICPVAASLTSLISDFSFLHCIFI